MFKLSLMHVFLYRRVMSDNGVLPLWQLASVPKMSSTRRPVQASTSWTTDNVWFNIVLLAGGQGHGFFVLQKGNRVVNWPVLEYLWWLLMENSLKFNPLSANPTKWWNTLKKIVGSCRRIVSVGLIILWGWRLKGWKHVKVTENYL